MSRCVFLSAGGDPFIASLVLKLWKERWYDEVDRMYVSYNNHAGVPQDVIGEFLKTASQDKKTHIIYHPSGIGNGMPITEMTLLAKEELVMLLEDDGFIFSSGHVDRNFQSIESDLTDAVGSPRFSCGQEIADASKKKYGLDYTGYGDVGCNFWPNFFFCKRADLLKTDLNFGSKTFQAGEHSKELDHTFESINHADTFGWGVIQLRAMGLRFHNVPQYHASPSEIEDRRKGEMNWWQGQKPYWIHGGSLSSGWSGYLQGRLPDVPTEGAKMEMETRCAFWTISAEQTPGFSDFKSQYLAGINKLVENVGLNSGRIEEKILLYSNLMQI